MIIKVHFYWHTTIIGNVKRKLSSQQSDSEEQPIEKKAIKSTLPILTIREAYRSSKKKKNEEEEWKNHGHLPRLSTAKKYVSNSKIWKTELSIADFHTNDGGYTSRPNNFKNMPEIRSLEEAKNVGFVIIKSENLWV